MKKNDQRRVTVQHVSINKKSIIKLVLGLCLIIIAVSGSFSEEPYFGNSEAVITFSGKIPQAPRISPNGKQLLYELYHSGQCEIVLFDLVKKKKYYLTRGKVAKAENGFWHPTQKYISFNVIPSGKVKNGYVYIAELGSDKLTKINKIDRGARAQFSRPNGNVIFYESTVSGNNTIKYRILGNNPLKPSDNRSIILRGPVQKISQNVELSHPSLAPNGVDLLFAARTASSGNALKRLNLTDGKRQRALGLWETVAKKGISKERLQTELDNIMLVDGEYKIDGPFVFKNSSEAKDGLPDTVNNYLTNSSQEPTIINGYTRKDFIICWLMGLFTDLSLNAKRDNQLKLYSRIWRTNVFGADIVPLVPDKLDIPLPQKWATVSSSGRFVVFEAGHYTNRHIYIISLKTKKVLRLTSAGSYNSSPELSNDEKWLYFETNRSGRKEIWRARLNLNKIMEKLGLDN